MSVERYPCYVKVGDGSDDMVEVPTERDGSLMLTSVKAQFPEAVGLRFKSDAGSWRGVRVNGNYLDPPIEGWGTAEYTIVFAKAGEKRVHGNATGPLAKLNKMSQSEILSDMIVLGLPYAVTDEELHTHFEQFGELAACEIKYDTSKKSRGFAFLRFKTVEAVEAALQGTHILHKRRCELRYPKQDKDSISTKLFVGRLPRGTTVEDLRDHFSEYGVLKDVYIPTPFKGFGFITYGSQADANHVLKLDHHIKEQHVNVTHPTEKRMEMNPGFGNNQGNMGPGGFIIGGGNMQSNMNFNNNMKGNMLSGGGGMLGNLLSGGAGIMGKMPQNGPGFGYGYGFNNSQGSGGFNFGNNTSSGNSQSGKTSVGNYVWNGGKS